MRRLLTFLLAPLALAAPLTPAASAQVPRTPAAERPEARLLTDTSGVLDLGFPTPAAAPGALALSVEDAIEIALEQGYAVRLAGLDVETAESQVSEAYGGLFPRVEGTSNYTRNVVQSNPFAGSSAASLFSGGAATGWLQFNELARTDGDPATAPITLAEYNRRVGVGQTEVGYNPANAANPFGTDNTVTNQLSVTQPLYSPTALAAVKGARSLVEVNEAGLQQQRDETVHQVRQLYYAAALAQAQAGVLEGSLERTTSTFNDATLLVAQGVRPRLEQLNAEVDVANVETELVAARAQAATATDRLLIALALPVETPVALATPLAVPTADLFEVAALAAGTDGDTVDLSWLDLDARPDIRQARLAIQLQEVQKSVTRAATLPGLSAFANLSYNGNIPDDRRSVFAADPLDPFTFTDVEPGPFDGQYWQPAVSVGLRLNWTLFDGFQTRRRVQQDQIAIDRAEIQLAQAQNAASLEVASAARQLRSARERLDAQTRTVRTAQTAYVFATERLDVGVAPLLDVRLASDNLEQARLNLLQAAYDALVARSDYERATGTIEAEALRPAAPFPALDPPPAGEDPTDPEPVVSATR